MIHHSPFLIGGWHKSKKNDPDLVLFPRKLEKPTTLMMLGISFPLDERLAAAIMFYQPFVYFCFP